MAIVSSTFRAPGGLAGAFKTFTNEVSLLAGALLSPARIIDEVEQMRALQVDANSIEATDPERAAVLRWRASRIGLH